MTIPSAHVPPRVKRLYYQSWHRGCKETDLLLGRFADAILTRLDDHELDLYEALLNEHDSDIWHWYTGHTSLPPQHHNRVWEQLKAINQAAVSK